MKNMIVLNMWC